MNKVFLIGRVGKDPEAMTFQSGATKVSFSVAISQSFKNKSGEWSEKTTWVDIECWRNMADRAVAKLSKGSLCFIGGSLDVQEWADKQTGAKRSRMVVVAQQIEAIDPYTRGGGGGQHPQAAQPQWNSGQYPQQPQQPPPPPRYHQQPQQPVPAMPTPGPGPGGVPGSVPPVGGNFEEDDVPF